MNAFGSPTRMLVRHLHHTGEQRQVNDLQQPARKLNRVAFTEFFGDDTMILKRIQFGLLMHTARQRATAPSRARNLGRAADGNARGASFAG